MLPEQEKPIIMRLSDVSEEEKRRHRRVRVTWPVAIDTVDGSIKVETKDLSPGGAFLACENPLPIGKQFRLTIELPDGYPLTLFSEVVWTNANVPNDKIVCRGMGIRFLKNGDEERTYLNTALSSYIEYHESNGLRVGTCPELNLL